MADWIKMRAAIMHSPRLITIANRLAAMPEFLAWLVPGRGVTKPLRAGRNERVTCALQCVTDDALRCVACALLMRVWSVAREFGEFVGDDLILHHMRAQDLDKFADCPGVGAAMSAVGWAVDDDENECVILPNFKQHNAPRTNADRQRQYRQRVTDRNAPRVTRALRGVTQTLRAPRHREEKRREENILSLSTGDVSQKLAAKFIDLGGGGKPERIAKAFAAKLRARVCAPEQLAAAIDEPGRDTSEPYWALLRRHGWDTPSTNNTTASRRRVPTAEEIKAQLGEEPNASQQGTEHG